MNHKISRLYTVALIMLVSAMFFATPASAVIACTSAQLEAAKNDPQLQAYCVQQQALIDAQKVTNIDFLKNLAKKNPPSPH